MIFADNNSNLKQGLNCQGSCSANEKRSDSKKPQLCQYYGRYLIIFMENNYYELRNKIKKSYFFVSIKSTIKSNRFNRCQPCLCSITNVITV